MENFRKIFLLTLLQGDFVTFGYLQGNLIWSRRETNFIPLEYVPAFYNKLQHFLSESHELENHNFQKEPLKVAYYEEKNIVHFYDNDTKMTGVCGELWHTMSEYLNFTLVPVKAADTDFGHRLPNGSFTGLLGMLFRNETQIIPRTGYYVAESKSMAYTVPFWSNSYKLYTRPEYKPDGSWIVRMFSKRVWCLILLLLISLSVLGYAMQTISMRVSGDKHFYHNLHDHFFYTFATFCCQGFIPDSLYRRTKILGFSKKIFAWLLLITVSSNLISWTTNQKVQPPFEDLETLFNNTKYNIVVFNGSIIYEKYMRKVKEIGALEKYPTRFYYVKSSQRLYEKACWGKKPYVILDSDDRQRAYGRFKCNLLSVGMNYFPTWVAAGVSKRFKYKKTLDKGLLKLAETGLIDVLKDRWFAISFVNINPTIVYTVGFEQISMLYLIFCTGIVFSVIFLILENIVFIYHYNNRKTRRRKTFQRRRR